MNLIKNKYGPILKQFEKPQVPIVSIVCKTHGSLNMALPSPLFWLIHFSG
jgi:hypothetical protein